MTDNDLASGPADDAPFVNPSGPVLASYLIRVTVHDLPEALKATDVSPNIPGLRDVNDLLKYQFEAITGCPVGVSSERVDD